MNTNRVDIFGTASLPSPSTWQLLTTTPPVTSNIGNVSVAWNGSTGFFRAGDADTDADGDGLPDGRETIMYGTDPNLADTDGDELPDGWEIAHGLNPCEADALGDPDGDHVGDADELADGTDPADSRSANRLVSVTIINKFSSALTNIVSYAFDEAPAIGANIVTQFAGNASISFPFSFTPETNLWIKAACDMDGDNMIDPAVEPVYMAHFPTFLTSVSIGIGDFDGDDVNDWLEYQYGSSPTNPASCHVTVSGTLTNLYSGVCTNYVTYGMTSAGWDGSAAIQIVKEGAFEFPAVPANSSPTIYVKAFCDLDGDGVRDTATEPLYMAAVTDFTKPTVSLTINDFDKDGVPDPEENTEGTNPANVINYCFSAGGVFTNALWLETDIRLAFERVQGTGISTLVDFAPTNGPFALPHAVTTVPATWSLRCYNDDDGNHAYDTNEFSRTYSLVRQHHDVRCDITVDDRTFDKDGDGMSDLWERLYSAVAIGVSDATDDPDGDGLINLHEYWSGTNPGVPDADPASNAMLNATLTIDSRIAGRNPTNALPIFVNYIANGTNGVFVRNTNCWVADLDLTCCSPWNNYDKNKEAGTLISPRHVLFAAHYDYIPTNRTLTFVDRQNNVITRTLVAKKRHWNYTPDLLPYPDLTVGLLDSDIPTNQITFAKVLPDNYADYIRDGTYLPAICLDQEEKALVGNVQYVATSSTSHLSTYTVPVDPVRVSLFETAILYDSGNPAFVIVNGQPVLLTVWTKSLLGTSVTALKVDINQLISELGGGYQLTEVDLSNFTQIP